MAIRASSGIIAISLDAGDNLIEAKITDGNNDMLIATRLGQAIRFSETDVRDMGRSATGVRGVSSLSSKDDRRHRNDSLPLRRAMCLS
jgi:DNA gyrase subunit A